jgi:hypothetical protein
LPLRQNNTLTDDQRSRRARNEPQRLDREAFDEHLTQFGPTCYRTSGAPLPTRLVDPYDLRVNYRGRVAAAAGCGSSAAHPSPNLNNTEGVCMSTTINLNLTRPQVLALYTRLTFALDWGKLDATEADAIAVLVDAMRAASPDEDLDDAIERVGPNTPLPRSGRGQQ